MNRPLKTEIFLRFGTQREASIVLKMDEAAVSRLVRERRAPTKSELKKFVRIFGREKTREFFGLNGASRKPQAAEAANQPSLS